MPSVPDFETNGEPPEKVPAEIRQAFQLSTLGELHALASLLCAKGRDGLTEMMSAVLAHGGSFNDPVTLSFEHWRSPAKPLVEGEMELQIGLNPRRCDVAFAKVGQELWVRLGHATEGPQAEYGNGWGRMRAASSRLLAGINLKASMNRIVEINVFRSGNTEVPDGDDILLLTFANLLGFPDSPRAINRIERLQIEPPDSPIRNAVYVYRGERVRIVFGQSEANRWMVRTIDKQPPGRYFRGRARLHRFFQTRPPPE